MLTKILSVSSILLGIYLLYIFLGSGEQSQPLPLLTDYHMGCFSPDNKVDHSSSIRDYISSISTVGQNQISTQRNFKIAHRINYQEVSRSVANDFQKYLTEYYQVKSKSIYEQNYYRNLNLADEKFTTCKNKVSLTFNKEQCRYDWSASQESHVKYEELKKTLSKKIEKKEQQQRKIAYLVIDNPNAIDQIEQNLTNQIKSYNLQLEQINIKKISLLKPIDKIQWYISTNKTQLEENQKVLKQCTQNMKIITFCTELTNQLNTIKLTFTKQDIQTKIQKKKFIIESFKNAIKNAQKLGDQEMVKINKQSLDKNQQELQLLNASFQSFQSFQESYCSKCSPQRIEQLEIDIEAKHTLILKHQMQLQRLHKEEESYTYKMSQISKLISQLQEQRDLYIQSKTCLTSECQQKRSEDIKEQRRILNEMKKQILDYKYIMDDHRIEHSKKITVINEWANKLNSVVDCLNQRKYYQALMKQKPSQSQQIGAKIQNLQNKLVEKLNALGPSTQNLA